MIATIETKLAIQMVNMFGKKLENMPQVKLDNNEEGIIKIKLAKKTLSGNDDKQVEINSKFIREETTLIPSIPARSAYMPINLGKNMMLATIMLAPIT